MDYFNFYEASGNFYKGNLHCHSTLSDGKLTPKQVVSYYKQHGYSFMALSDHNVFVLHNDLCDDNFITLPTIEWSSEYIDAQNRWIKTHHIHGFMDCDTYNEVQNPLADGEKLVPPSFDGISTANYMRDYLNSRGTFCMYNHPNWSKTNHEDYGNLDGFVAMEIHNYGCEIENHTESSLPHWDYLLDKGVKIFGVATDDNHNRFHGTNLDDSFGGFICVKAESLSRENIVKAIKLGHFYSSSGPAIHDISVEDNTVTVTCSNVHHINFISGPKIGGGLSVWSKDNDNSLGKASYEFDSQNDYIRIECVDKFGKTAWSNPIYIK